MKTFTLPLAHKVYSPPVSKQNLYPTVFMLHGYGSDANDLFSFAPELSTEHLVISLEAPLKLQPFGHAWYTIYMDATQGKFSDDEEAINSRELVMQCINAACEAYPIKQDAITLLGFSQGCILSLAVALSYPQKIKNVIGLSGYLNEAILLPNWKNNVINTLNIYHSHGSQDQVIPVNWARTSSELLKPKITNYVYEEFPVGHGVSPHNFHSFRKWLSAH